MTDTSVELRKKARRYRDLARLVSDGETTARILAFTDELDNRAMLLEQLTQEEIRKRAREFWEAAGRPPGRDEEFWYRAEKELRQGIGLSH